MPSRHLILDCLRPPWYVVYYSHTRLYGMRVGAFSRNRDTAPFKKRNVFFASLEIASIGSAGVHTVSGAPTPNAGSLLCVAGHEK